MRKMRPITKEETLYCFDNSQEIESKTGFIGSMRCVVADGGLSTKWKTNRKDLYSSTNVFKELDDILNSYMKKEFESFFESENIYKVNDYEYGFRIDSDETSYLIRLTAFGKNEYIYVYIKKHLDEHIKKANRKGIRFIDSHYNTLFFLEDGESIVIEDISGFRTPQRVCRYIDDYHTKVGRNIFHICEFAEKMENYHNKVIPLRSSLPEQCYIYVQTENKIGVVKKGESGYYKTDILECNGIKSHSEAKKFVSELNLKLDVTPAQSNAMMAGSMFGWHTLAADPHNYNDNGTLKKPKE